MIQRGDPITVLHLYKVPVRGFVTIVNTVSGRGTPLEHALVDWRPEDVMSPNFVIHLLSEYSEGWVWARGHGDEQDRALLAARALA